MSDVLDQLHTEHKNIARLLDLLHEQLDVFSEGGPADYVLMSDIMQYMTNYPDLFHHPKEDVLFQRLLTRDPAAEKEIGGLLEKHVVLAEAGNRFAGLLRNVVGEFLTEREALESEGRGYVDMLREHMDIEEGKVFPLAEKVFNAQDWIDIDNAVEAMEDPLFGNVVANEYLVLFDYIKQESR